MYLIDLQEIKNLKTHQRNYFFNKMLFIKQILLLQQNIIYLNTYEENDIFFIFTAREFFPLLPPLSTKSRAVFRQYISLSVCLV